MIVNTEVSNLSIKAVGPTNPERTTRIFNAGLTIMDSQGEPRPYLAEANPTLNTDSWKVLPDGQMETIWKLRPGLKWHDGEALTADDFVFAHQVYTAPGLSVFEPKPQSWIERVTAPDPQTVHISWRSPYLDTGQGLDPLPRHILAEPLASLESDAIGQRDAFLSHRFWTMDYVGAGPFRLTNWEPASHLEGAAFDGHALGRPKIDRVILRFMNDENTAFATVLAGEAHYVMRDVVGFEKAMILRRQGFDGVDGKGKLLSISTATITAVAQHRPEHQQSQPLLDPRVRRAILHALDKDAINLGLFEGHAPVPHTFVPPEAPYFAEIERIITKYPYDPRRTEQIMNEVGYSKDNEGFFATPRGDRFQPAFWNSAGPQQDQLLPIVVNSWQRAGIDVQPFVMPNALARDQQARATFPGILVHGIGLSESTSAMSLVSEQIGTPANRWTGNNRGGWSNPDYERLWNRFNATLDRSEQVQAFQQMMRMQSEWLPNFPLYYLLGFTIHLSALKGPDNGVNATTSHWNMYEWELDRTS